MDRRQLLRRLEKAWAAFKASYEGLPEAQLMTPGVTGEWSVKDILGHVSTWEEEALKYLPVILAGGKPPRYSTTYGGIDAFNARMTAARSRLPLFEVRRILDETHQRLINLIEAAPEEQLTSETRFRRRLRSDTYSHYPKHEQAIRKWRAAREKVADDRALTSRSHAKK